MCVRCDECDHGHLIVSCYFRVFCTIAVGNELLLYPSVLFLVPFEPLHPPIVKIVSFLLLPFLALIVSCRVRILQASNTG
ncbi:hypothetical protein F5H01DRAFT_337967 [Linnemannia elongata]|nr:hypothetical protein F5H01DRAFT_337967 [Linnemannia elongata]